MEIIKLPPARWEDYRFIRLEALKREPAAFCSAYEEEKALPSSVWKRRIKNCFFATSDDEIVGVVGYSFRERVKDRHIAEVFGLYVKKGHRGKGVGRDLMKSALSDIQNNKEIIKARLSVNAEQRAAIGLYERLGFVVVGRMKNELKVGPAFFDQLIMEKYFTDQEPWNSRKARV